MWGPAFLNRIDDSTRCSGSIGILLAVFDVARVVVLPGPGLVRCLVVFLDQLAQGIVFVASAALNRIRDGLDITSFIVGIAKGQLYLQIGIVNRRNLRSRLGVRDIPIGEFLPGHVSGHLGYPAQRVVQHIDRRAGAGGEGSDAAVGAVIGIRVGLGTRGFLYEQTV